MRTNTSNSSSKSTPVSRVPADPSHPWAIPGGVDTESPGFLYNAPTALVLPLWLARDPVPYEENGTYMWEVEEWFALAYYRVWETKHRGFADWYHVAPGCVAAFIRQFEEGRLSAVALRDLHHAAGDGGIAVCDAVRVVLGLTPLGRA